jgi:hypothetical protein
MTVDFLPLRLLLLTLAGWVLDHSKLQAALGDQERGRVRERLPEVLEFRISPTGDY